MPLRQPTHANYLYQQAALTSRYQKCLCVNPPTPTISTSKRLSRHVTDNACVKPPPSVTTQPSSLTTTWRMAAFTQTMP